MKTVFCLIAASFMFAVVPFTASAADNLGEYGKAEIEIDRSVYQDMENYQPPQMFGAPPSTRVPTPLPPSHPELTAPTPESLLQHPIENNHVFTRQEAVKPTPQVAPKAVANAPLTPMPNESAPQVAAPAVAALPPVPPRKPSGIPQDLGQPEIADLPSAPALQKEEPKKIEPVKVVAKPVASPAPKAAYRPSAPKTMPAVPPIKVDEAPLPLPAKDMKDAPRPVLGNLPPPVEPEKAEKPSASERLMDDALTRHMVKNNDEVKAVLGVPADSEPAMDQFSMAFKSGQTELSDDQMNLLKHNVVTHLSSDKLTRIQIRAYAGQTDGTESSSRRISLSRALAVRSYLLENGIKPTRVDVRALSDKTSDPLKDRVDIAFEEAQ